MAYQTLYRKYRPKSFDLVYGQDIIVKTLKNVIKNDKLSHAYLFTGPRGTGKTSCAKLFAKAINCLDNESGDACNKCENCISFNNNSNPDIIEIDAASNNGVDEIREIKNKVNLVPTISKYKVYIIDEVHMLSIGAFNALLKTLEEPPEYVIFILATTEPQKLPTTVISRCQRFDFKSISNESMKQCLKNILEKEKINIDSLALNEIILNSNGGMRDAIGMLDQAFAFSDKKITLDDIQELSGTISDKQTVEILMGIINKKYSDVIKFIKKISNQGKDFTLILQKIMIFLYKIILYKKNVELNNIEKFNDFDFSIFKSIDERILYKLLDDTTDLNKKLNQTSQKELIFEVYILKMMDELNVSRETLNEKFTEKEKKKISIQDELDNNIKKLKDIRINNILKESTKQEFNKIKDEWNTIKEYLFDEKIKKYVTILLDAVPVAASSNGIILSIPTEGLLKKIESNYDECKELIHQKFNNKYKIVCITVDYWKKIRPKYVELVKNNMLDIKDEEFLLSKIKKMKENDSVNDFNELIEMEEK